ncbi:MAG: aldo/keto reductase [Chloroflexi bacterium]|nr:aldo/keto reductase [Chloroflexota bacterium]
MKYRKLGRTGLMVSEVGFGVWTVSTDWWGKVEPEDGVRLLQDAYSLGVNLFDTADTYGDGFGEEILSRALGRQRQEIIIATKGGYDLYAHPVRQGHRERPQSFEPQFIRFACEQSLRRLKTDYIDLYQLHNPRLDTVQRDEVFALLNQLVREGKVRYYGAALGPDIGWFEEGDAAMRTRGIASLQVIYSILEQQPARRFFPTAEQHGVGLLSRVPHASEVLTDQFRRQPPVFQEGDHRALRRQAWLQAAVRKVATLDFLLQHHPTPLGQAAIRFCLAQPAISSVLPNITSGEQLQEYAAASGAEPLCQECLDRLLGLYDDNFGLGAEGATEGLRTSAAGAQAPTGGS